MIARHWAHEVVNVSSTGAALMKVITLYQPRASLVAVGVKTIETRSWSTTYRGPLAIHAAKRQPDVDNIGGPFGIDITQSALDSGNFYAYRRPNPPGKVDTFWPLPLGGVVAVCDLVDVVPMVDSTGCTDSKHLCIVNESMLLHSPLDEPWPNGETEHIVSDQLPFGDYRPGRFAWILENIRPLVDPYPMKGGQGLRRMSPGDIEAVEADR